MHQSFPSEPNFFAAALLFFLGARACESVPIDQLVVSSLCALFQRLKCRCSLIPPAADFVFVDELFRNSPTVRQRAAHITTTYHPSCLSLVPLTFLQFVDHKEFHGMVYKLNNKAKIPQRKALVQRMRDIKKELEVDVSRMLKGQYVCMTTDAWTSRKNETYMSLTLVYIDEGWQLRTLSLACAKHTGSTTGEDLAKLVEGMMESHGVTGRVISFVTDCEASMVKAGRLVEDSHPQLQHVGCSNHRLESTTSSVFEGKSLRAITLSRALVTRYTKSSQHAGRLNELCAAARVKPLCVVQDVPTRWWSTYAMVSRLLYLRQPIKLHETMDNLDPLLSESDWEVLKLVSPLLEPFMEAQKKLEGADYVTGSLTIPTIGDLRVGLRAAIDNLRNVDGGYIAPVVREAMAVVLPDAEALWKDFVNRWGDGTATLKYKEGPRRQPQGFKLVQVLATALDPRTKCLFPILAEEQPAVWKAVIEAAVDVALEKEQPMDETAGGTQESPVVLEPGAGTADEPAAKRPRLSPSEEAAAAHAANGDDSSSAPSKHDERERMATIVGIEVAAFKGVPGITRFDNVGGKRVYNDPLKWWRSKQRDFPLLAALARRVLALPASQAQSERMFSTAGKIVTPVRNQLASENVELLVYLHSVWGPVEEWRKSARQK